MDLRFMESEPTEAERHHLEGLIPTTVTVALPGRVVISGRAARSQRNQLLPALASVQSQFGWVSPGALNEICRRLSVPPAEAYGVATFYSLISTEPRPARVAHICDDIACRQSGGLDLLESMGARDDVIASPCLGQCDRRPAALVQRAGEEDLVLGPATTGQIETALAGEGAGLLLGEPLARPYRVKGNRLLRRVGLIDPASLDAYRREGGFEALAEAFVRGPGWVIDQVKTSGLKGRGGAAFPTGVKWEAASRESAPRYLVCNADESEPGTFKDRVIMEGDPFALVEAMTIAAWATGCGRGFLYIRGEYPGANRLMLNAVDRAREEGLLGPDVLGTGFDFDIEIRLGQGAYICGEETALFNSIEGFRGEPRQKPPFPVQAGLFGRPTVINNVETLVNIPAIVLEGGPAFATLGTSESTGTRLFCLSGDVAEPGVYEVPFGASLGDLIAGAGGTVGEPSAILLGGAAGSFVGPDRSDLPLTFEATRLAGVSLGSGVIMVFNRTRDMKDVVRRIARFFRDESCGQCVPCRVGTVRVEEAVARANGSIEAGLIEEIDRAMKDASICGLGHTAASAVRSAIAAGLLGVTR